MSGTKKKIKEIMYLKWGDVHGKKRYLYLLVVVIFGTVGGFLVVFIREHFSYRIYQLFVLFVIILIVWFFGTEGLKWRKERERSDI